MTTFWRIGRCACACQRVSDRARRNFGIRGRSAAISCDRRVVGRGARSSRNALADGYIFYRFHCAAGCRDDHLMWTWHARAANKFCATHDIRKDPDFAVRLYLHYALA